MSFTSTLFIIAALLGPFNLNSDWIDRPNQVPVLSTAAPEVTPLVVLTRAEGRVVVEVRLAASGEVISARSTEGHWVLRKQAELAALRWRFAASSEVDRVVYLRFDFKILPADASDEAVAPLFTLPYDLTVKYRLPKRPGRAEYSLSGQETDQRCAVHQEYLKRDIVNITYGLTFLSPEAIPANESFPNAKSFVSGECVIEYRGYESGAKELVSPEFAEVLYCQACRDAQKRWLSAHPLKSPTKR